MPRDPVIIVGAGIVGLATAYQLQLARPGARVVVLEKERTLAAHQTGRNSGVIHSGIYYKPGSLKATNCRRGKAMLEGFCREHTVPFDICGKVIVATCEDDLPALERILERGRANGVACERIGPERLRELEPHAAGIAAIRVPEAGIIDYGAVCEALARCITHAGGEVHTGARVTAIDARPGACSDARHATCTVESTLGEHRARLVINCAGLHSDRVAALSTDGAQPLPARIVPFRGEYYELAPAARRLCNNLIYPVPDPRFPFLGVHFTRMLAGGVECGPNAVLALAREGYTWADIEPDDLADTLGYPGFWRMIAQHWRMGLGEMHRSLVKGAFVRALQRLVPAIRAEDLSPAPAGVRAQALAPDGRLVDDFLIRRRGPVIDVLNAPSPAATSALAIGERVAALAA
ncbi:MAG: L-2-hydroxyglutarate oxidase [Phycisphaerales bacterium]|nr:L-2-hydroxyglutarate oxidase [Phycisphaerales bacterium]